MFWVLGGRIITGPAAQSSSSLSIPGEARIQQTLQIEVARRGCELVKAHEERIATCFGARHILHGLDLCKRFVEEHHFLV